MAAEYTLGDLVREMRQVAAETDDPAEIAERLRAPARRLALARGWLEPRFFDRDEEQGFGIYSLHEEPDHRLSVVVASLLPGRSLPPHNHRTWALQVGIVGREINVSWRRTDDGSRPGFAEIEEAGRTVFGPLLVSMQQDLGVRLGPEAVALGLQVGAQLVIVIDLAVEDNPDGPVFIRQRLVTADEVDNRQTSMS